MRVRRRRSRQSLVERASRRYEEDATDDDVVTKLAIRHLSFVVILDAIARAHLVRRVVQSRHIYRLFRAPLFAIVDRRARRTRARRRRVRLETLRVRDSFPSFEHSYCLYIHIDANRRFM